MKKIAKEDYYSCYSGVTESNKKSIHRENFKVVVRAEILPRDFLQTLGNYYL